MASEKFEEGLKIRKEVVGEEYVNNSLKNADELTMPLQELVTEYCWGSVPRKTRSLLNLVMLTALNRPHELRLHLVGAINNGCSKEEIMEALLQTAIYCGVPAAIDSTKIAKEVLAEL
jgi:4-carboxymuconolactone decarboxylase